MFKYLILFTLFVTNISYAVEKCNNNMLIGSWYLHSVQSGANTNSLTYYSLNTRCVLTFKKENKKLFLDENVSKSWCDSESYSHIHPELTLDNIHTLFDGEKRKELDFYYKTISRKYNHVSVSYENGECISQGHIGVRIGDGYYKKLLTFKMFLVETPKNNMWNTYLFVGNGNLQKLAHKKYGDYMSIRCDNHTNDICYRNMFMFGRQNFLTEGFSDNIPNRVVGVNMIKLNNDIMDSFWPGHSLP